MIKMRKSMCRVVAAAVLLLAVCPFMANGQAVKLQLPECIILAEQKTDTREWGVAYSYDLQIATTKAKMDAYKRFVHSMAIEHTRIEHYREENENTSAITGIFYSDDNSVKEYVSEGSWIEGGELLHNTIGPVNGQTEEYYNPKLLEEIAKVTTVIKTTSDKYSGLYRVYVCIECTGKIDIDKLFPADK